MGVMWDLVVGSVRGDATLTSKTENNSPALSTHTWMVCKRTEARMLDMTEMKSLPSEARHTPGKEEEG